MDYFPCFKVLSEHYPKNVDRVYGLIWQYCKESGECSTPIYVIAKTLGLTRPTVNKAIRFLKHRKFIVDKVPPYNQLAHTYTIIPETLEEVNAMWKRGELDG